ncbi:hypothetical protein SNE40_008839 [Patella caerulea]|uniref:Chitin-binding type-2 domain-containing protein n=1 Tax=Patella caerulea TaxID=87958 RepID=A0AAN8JVJ8_PATCE
MKGVLVLGFIAVHLALVSCQAYYDQQLQGQGPLEGDGCTEFELAMTYVPHPSDCSKFYRCSLPRMVKEEFSCPQGQAFDAKYHNCRSARDGEC